MWVFVLAVVLGFLVLAAQYESWSLPRPSILVVPMCLSALLPASGGEEMDINSFTQVGLRRAHLPGVQRRFLLRVEFARTSTETGGAPLLRYAWSVVPLRRRTIIMTRFAFILGVVPLIMRSEAPALNRRPWARRCSRHAGRDAVRQSS